MIFKRYGHKKSRLDELHGRPFLQLPLFQILKRNEICNIALDFIDTLKPYDAKLPKTRKDKVIINYKNVPKFKI